MDEKCYHQQVANELAVNEYKILADMIRLFYDSKYDLKNLYKSNKISEECYNYFLENFPVAMANSYVFPKPIKNFPIEFGGYHNGEIWMRMEDGKEIVVENVSDHSNYIIDEITERKNYYKKHKRMTYENNKLQREEWGEYIIERSSTFYFRENDMPSIVEEDGTQIWTTIPGAEVDGKILSKLYKSDDPYYKKYRTYDLFIDRYNPTKPAVIKPDGTRLFYRNGRVSKNSEKINSLMVHDPVQLREISIGEEFMKRLRSQFDDEDF
jgi:hypothetical protein